MQTIQFSRRLPVHLALILAALAFASCNKPHGHTQAASAPTSAQPTSPASASSKCAERAAGRGAGGWQRCGGDGSEGGSPPTGAEDEAGDEDDAGDAPELPGTVDGTPAMMSEEAFCPLGGSSMAWSFSTTG